MAPRRPPPGPALVGVGLAVLLVTATLGPVLAAPGAGADAGGDAPATVVGVQGVGSYTDGGYVALLNGTREVWREGSADTYFDVTARADGSVVAAYASADAERCGSYGSPCARTGVRVVEPDAGGGVATTTAYEFPVRSHTNSEVHDAEPLPGGGYVLADMDRERILVVEDGRIAWEWRAAQRYDPPADPTRTDWLHLNDVDRIGEGRFLVSVRNANQLVVLERGTGVVEVINADTDDDGVLRGDPDLLHRQHNPQWLGDGAVLVADSENHRIVELHRTADGDWERVWTLRRAGGSRFDWPRDADRLPGGTTLITDTRNARLVEVDESGDVLREVRLDYRTLPYEADRLPVGEPVGAPRYGVGGGVATATAANGTEPAPVAATPVATAVDGPRRVPVLTPGLRLLSAAVRLPRWFAEGHLLAAVAGLALVGIGVVVGWRSRGGER
jgi:hypothetical protein